MGPQCFHNGPFPGRSVLTMLQVAGPLTETPLGRGGTSGRSASATEVTEPSVTQWHSLAPARRGVHPPAGSPVHPRRAAERSLSALAGSVSVSR